MTSSQDATCGADTEKSRALSARASSTGGLPITFDEAMIESTIINKILISTVRTEKKKITSLQIMKSTTYNVHFSNHVG